jgi:hypothetical protein
MQASRKDTLREEKCIVMLNNLFFYVTNPFYVIPVGFETIYTGGLARILIVATMTSWGLGMNLNTFTIALVFLINDFLFFKDMMEIAKDLENK